MYKKYNKINLQTYKFLLKGPSAWYCMKCFQDIVPFGNSRILQGSKIKLAALIKNHGSHSKGLTNQLNGAMNDPLSETVSSQYYETCELSFLLKNSKNYQSFVHLNISLFYFHIEELATLI